MGLMQAFCVGAWSVRTLSMNDMGFQHEDMKERNETKMATHQGQRLFKAGPFFRGAVPLIARRAMCISTLKGERLPYRILRTRVAHVFPPR